MSSTLKYLALTLGLLLLASCSSDAPGDSDSEVKQAATASTSEQETVQPHTDQPIATEAATSEKPPRHDSLSLISSRLGDLDMMEESRVIRMLTVYGPGRYHLDGANAEGLVAEMASLFEKFINKHLGNGSLRTHVVVIPVARDELIPALLAGKGDIVSASLTITPERAEEVDFSIPTSKPLSEILVTGPSAPALESIDGLSGQTLFLRESSSYRESVEALNQRFAAANKAPVNIHYMSELLEDDDLIEMVNAGLLPWAIVDEYKPQLWEGVFNELVVRDDIVFREGGQLGWAMRKNSPKLEAAVNAFLKKNREGTLIGNVLRNRYIRDYDYAYAANALGSEEYTRFRELQTLFRDYGEEYGVDYLLAAAQGYQESRLDQSVRSHAGAIGVMQLLPTTAADPKVGITNIHEVEANIHAGIKYLNYLRNRYFDDPAISRQDQTFLALAAYNAGPSRMINLRAKAEKAGYDPNRWFDNVEVIAAREIGGETVQYVANIYKYYLSYRMVAMQELNRLEAREDAGI